uniref:Serine protease 55-like n=1 Tax=Geotrypetes seraphini TaxID=260995 RepID=A0A6P8PBZ1_GEOSA|nr:serine protease 55-like [Geotrypetes seraphini]
MNRSANQSRIIGGSNAQPGEWPWAVSLQLFNEPFCGGAILDAWWVLSAAHCFQDPIYRSKNMRVEVGATILSQNKEMMEVQKVVVHSKYTSWNDNNDIALLLLSTPITFNLMKMPICLPPTPKFKHKDWHTCYVVGWGTVVASRAKATKHLQKVEMALIKQSLCKKWYPTLTSNMLCAGYEEGGRDSCQGDSGGPLMCKYWKTNFWYEVGIVSWGKGCAQKRRPGVYTRVSKYVKWIIDMTAELGKPYIPDEEREEPFFGVSYITTSKPYSNFTTAMSPSTTFTPSSVRSTGSSSSSLPFLTYHVLLTKRQDT